MNTPAESPQLNLTEETFQQGNRTPDLRLKRSFYQLSITLASDAIARDPTSATTYQQRAKAYFYSKQYDQALLDYLQAIYYGSQDMFTYLGSYALLKILQFPGENNEDLQTAEVLYNLNSKQSVHWTDTDVVLKKVLIDVAYIQSSQGKYQELLSICQTLLNLAPYSAFYDVLTYSNQLIAHMQLHEYEAALLDCLVLKVIDKARDYTYQTVEENLIELMRHQYKLQQSQPFEVLMSPLILSKPLVNESLNKSENTAGAKPSKNEKPAKNPQMMPSGIHKKHKEPTVLSSFFSQPPKNCKNRDEHAEKVWRQINYSI